MQTQSLCQRAKAGKLKVLYVTRPYLPSKQVNDFKGVLEDPDGHQLLAVVSAMHHEGVTQTLNNWALSLSEPFHLVSAT